MEELQEKLRQAPTQEALLGSVEAQSQLRQQVCDTMTVRCSQAETIKPKPLQQEALPGFPAAPPGKQQPLKGPQE